MLFYELPNAVKTLIIALMLLFNLFQFSYVALLTQHKKRQQALFHIIVLALLGMTIPFLAENLQYKNFIGAYLKLTHFFVFYLISWPIYICLFIKEFVSGKSILGKNAVKEAMDQLPVAICFFSLDGVPVLCNMKMYYLAYDLLGKDLQTMSELKDCLNAPSKNVKLVHLGKEPVFLLMDQTVWHFLRTDITDLDGREYIQVVGTDVTHLYRLQNELDERNDELQEMLQKIQKVSENIADIVRSKEVLSAKERVHGKMGSALLTARRFMSENNDSTNKEQLLNVWRDTLSSLRNEIDSEEEKSVFDEILQLAKNIGVEIEIDGLLPEETKRYEIVICGLREMLTNTVRHAAGHHLHLKITYDKHQIIAIYTNDGTPPSQEVIEGGGLSMLRKKVEQFGGIMNIQSKPVFSLQIIMNDDALNI